MKSFLTQFGGGAQAEGQRSNHQAFWLHTFCMSPRRCWPSADSCICSEIIDNFLYLGGDLVAKDTETFQKIGITHVVNCAADYSDDYHKNMGVIYKSYHLKDHVREDIACVFYDAIEFLQEARASGGKCYVHCVQGISRSATICCAYMILTEGLTYNEAYERVKARRACANPNLQFI